MLKWLLAFGFVVMGTSAQAFDGYDSDAAAAEYDESYLQVEECFADEVSDQEACIIEGIQECVKDLEALLESKGFSIPGGAAVSPDEYCNYIGLERADKHLNAVYRRMLDQGPALVHYQEEGIANLRTAQRLWLQFANEMCSGSIIGWHAGGSGWGATVAECRTRLSIQQAGLLERYFTINY